MLSYEQTLKLFGVWLADTTAVTRVEDIREKHMQGCRAFCRAADLRAYQRPCFLSGRHGPDVVRFLCKGQPAVTTRRRQEK